MSKTITVVEEYDKDGKLIKKTTTTTEGDTSYIPYPTYPYTPNTGTGDPWWQNPVTYVTNSTTTINSEKGKDYPPYLDYPLK